MAAERLANLSQIARSVNDVVRSERWYREVLGLTHLYTYGRLAFFDLGGTRLMLSENGDAATGESVLYFQVTDIGAQHAALAGRGVRFTDAPRRLYTHPDGTEEWMAFFADPDGRLLALSSQVRAAGRPGAGD